MPGQFDNLMQSSRQQLLLRNSSKEILANCQRQILHDPTYLWNRDSFLEGRCGEGHFLNNSFSSVSYFSVLCGYHWGVRNARVVGWPGNMFRVRWEISRNLIIELTRIWWLEMSWKSKIRPDQEKFAWFTKKTRVYPWCLSNREMHKRF